MTIVCFEYYRIPLIMRLSCERHLCVNTDFTNVNLRCRVDDVDLHIGVFSGCLQPSEHPCILQIGWASANRAYFCRDIFAVWIYTNDVSALYELDLVQSLCDNYRSRRDRKSCLLHTYDGWLSNRCIICDLAQQGQAMSQRVYRSVLDEWASV